MAKKPKPAKTASAKTANAGSAQKRDRSSALARSEVPSFLTEEQLDARQEQIGLKRRSGGPSLDGDSDNDLIMAMRTKPKRDKKNKKKKKKKKRRKNTAAGDRNSAPVGPTDIPDSS